MLLLIIVDKTLIKLIHYINTRIMLVIHIVYKIVHTCCNTNKVYTDTGILLCDIRVWVG